MDKSIADIDLSEREQAFLKGLYEHVHRGIEDPDLDSVFVIKSVQAMHESMVETLGLMPDGAIRTGSGHAEVEERGSFVTDPDDLTDEEREALEILGMDPDSHSEEMSGFHVDDMTMDHVEACETLGFNIPDEVVAQIKARSQNEDAHTH